MSQKDFIALADLLRLLRPVSEPGTYERFRDALAEYCRSTSPSGFDSAGWLAYIDETHPPKIHRERTYDVSPRSGGIPPNPRGVREVVQECLASVHHGANVRL